MRDFLKHNPLFKFLGIAVLAYLVWFTVYEGFIKYPATPLDRYISISLVETADVMLSIVGYDAVPNYETAEVTIKLADSQWNGVWVGDKCNGMELFALFSIFVLAFPGPWKTKAWYLPAGLLAIHLINSLRVAVLTVIERDAPETLDFNHNYTFTFIVYGFILYLWYLWTSKFSGLNTSQNETET